MGVQHNFTQVPSRAAASTTQLTEAELRRATATTQEAKKWIQLDHNLKYMLIVTTTAAAATLCRQHQHEIGLEIYRQLLMRFKTPIGTRSVGYVTKFLEPTFDINNFEESFSNWEYDVQQYESHNNAPLPDQLKVAVLMNRTRGPLQQHLHLNAGSSPTFVEIRTTNTDDQRAHTQHSADYGKIHHQQFQQTTMEEQHQWTQEQSAKESTPLHCRRFLYGYSLDSSDFPCYFVWPHRTQGNSFWLLESQTNRYVDLSLAGFLRPLGIQLTFWYQRGLDSMRVILALRSC